MVMCRQMMRRAFIRLGPVKLEIRLSQRDTRVAQLLAQ